MTTSSTCHHDGSESSEPSTDANMDDASGSEADQMSQAALASMHPDTHEFDWRYYHNALQM